MAREDDYDQPQSLFSSLIENISHNSIQQVWKVTRHRGQKSEPQYFHISLISQRWYNNSKYNEHEKNVMPIYHIGENKLSELEQPIPQLSFQHLANFRQTPNIVQLQGPKQKYRFVKCFIENTKVELFEHQENIVSMHIGNPLRVQHKGRQSNRYRSCGEPQKKKARHMRNITNITNNENEERVVTTQAGKTRERYCKKCHQTGHYAPQCPNV
ncbi:unnamed protein product [Rhizophagus irregularis]|nr:unnamed protein product [Rhizophagus irregularis]